jgi:hypothetical protein
MANSKITELPATTLVDSTDVLPIVDISDGETKKVTIQQLTNFVTSSIVIPSASNESFYFTTSDQLILSSTIVDAPMTVDDINGPILTASVPSAGSYKLHFNIYLSSSNLDGVVFDGGKLGLLQLNTSGTITEDSRVEFSFNAVDADFNAYVTFLYPSTSTSGSTGLTFFDARGNDTNDGDGTTPVLFPVEKKIFYYKIDGYIRAASSGSIGWKLFVLNEGLVSGSSLCDLYLRAGSGIRLTKLS